MFDALAARYTTPLRHEDYERARSKIAHNAFVPSNAWQDTGIWSSRPSASIRQVHAFGTLTPAGYRFSSVSTVPGLRGLGDSRHGVTLIRLADGLYRWETLADYRLGSIAPQRAAGAFPAMFAAAEGRSEQSVRGDYLGTFPRTSAALGRYANMDTIRPTRLPDGSTSVRAVITLHASRLSGSYPALAEYLAKYTSKSRMRIVMRDRSGAAPATWFVMDARNDRITIDARVRNGQLVPFHGPPRPFPDSFEMVVDAIATVGPFTAGFETLRTDVVRSSTARDHSWTITAKREPEWRLPLFAERLLRSPLRRPFEGAGSVYVVGFREDAGGTILHRFARTTVQESAILRFINRIGSRAFGDISPQVEAEEAAYLRTIFTAMREDLGALQIAD